MPNGAACKTLRGEMQEETRGILHRVTLHIALRTLWMIKLQWEVNMDKILNIINLNCLSNTPFRMNKDFAFY
jgi:hypothetical protein